MDDPYGDLRHSVTQAGYYMPSTEDMGTWQRLIVCSQGPPDYKRFNGRSFWVTLIDRSWYVATWGPYYYRLPNSDDLLPVIRDHLSETGTMYDFSAEIKNRYGLVPLDESEVERFLPDLRIEN
jgi:hypothetical protein